MASHLLAAGAHPYPVGTTVEVYEGQRKNVADGAPSGDEITTAVVASDGSLTISGLAENGRYRLAAQVDGSWRWVSILVRTGEDSASRPLEVYNEGVLMPLRRSINFTGGLVNVTDDPVAERLEAAIAGNASEGGGFPFFNVFDFGVVMDGLYITVGMTNGSDVATSASWVAEDVGKAILVPGAGPAGVDLQSTVSSVTPGVSATLAHSASTTVTGAHATYGTDDRQAWQDALNHMDTPNARGGTLVAHPPEGVNERHFSVIGGELIADGLQGCAVEGQSHGGNAFPILAFLHGTGAGLRVRSNLNTRFTGLTLQFHRQYGSSTNFVMLETDSAGTDNMNVVFERLGFQAGQFVDLPDLRSWLHLNVAIFCHIVECRFTENFSGHGVELGSGYVNVCSLRRNVYNGPRNHVYIASGDCEALTIQGETFEPTYAGQSGAIVGGPTCFVYRGVIRDCWFGDIGLGGRGHIENVDCFGGMQVVNNMMHGAGPTAGIVVSTIRAGSALVNELQRLVFIGEGGTFTLTYDGQTTGAISWDADVNVLAAAVQAALEGLSNIGVGDVAVTPNLPAIDMHILDVEFEGALALTNVAQMTAASSLTGTSAHFRDIDGGPWEIHSNFISGAFVLFDFTNLTPTGVNFHDNAVGCDDVLGGGSLPVPSNASGTPGFRAWANQIQSGGAPIPETGDWTEVQRTMPNPHTLEITDAGKFLKSVNNASALTVTVPPAADVAFAIGTRLRVMQGGTGQVTIAAGSGVTVSSPNGSLKLRTQKSVATLVKIASAEWVLFGDLEPSSASIPTVASAATIAIPSTVPPGGMVTVNGTTNITSITAGYPQQRVVLKFAGILTVTDGSNLLIAGDFVTSSNDTLELMCDGTNWIEVGRSVN